MSASMLTGKLGSEVTVSLISNPTKFIKVTVTKRGPYARGRIIELTPAAFYALTGSMMDNVVQVIVNIL